MYKVCWRNIRFFLSSERRIFRYWKLFIWGKPYTHLSDCTCVFFHDFLIHKQTGKWLDKFGSNLLFRFVHYDVDNTCIFRSKLFWPCLAKIRVLWILPTTVGNTGILWVLPGNTGQYLEIWNSVLNSIDIYKKKKRQRHCTFFV